MKKVHIISLIALTFLGLSSMNKANAITCNQISTTCKKGCDTLSNPDDKDLCKQNLDVYLKSGMKDQEALDQACLSVEVVARDAGRCTP